jgi:hypothetical protein
MRKLLKRPTLSIIGLGGVGVTPVSTSSVRLAPSATRKMEPTLAGYSTLCSKPYDVKIGLVLPPVVAQKALEVCADEWFHEANCTPAAAKQQLDLETAVIID